MSLDFSLLACLGFVRPVHCFACSVLRTEAVRGVCRYEIVAGYLGVRLPARERKVLVKVVDGMRQYEKKMVVWKPCANTCENIRAEMGPFAQLEVGEVIIKAGGSAGSFGLHMDGASSEGRELNAFVLGHRADVRDGEPSRIRNLLFDIRWAMDKTSATRAADFRHICSSVAKLCAAADMKDTHLIAELQPSATMTDRANAELKASQLITQSKDPNPTCGEHGGLVNPLSAASGAMDAVVCGWMGKTDADAKLEEHKVRALHMAVGWNKSPSGALIYCTCKYAAPFSDKGYSVGQEARGYNEYLASLSPDDRESILLLGHMEDLLSIKGSRAYVGPLNAPVVDRILTDGPGSFYRFCKEQEELARPGGGKIRKQIIAGAESPEIRSCVRAEAILGDFFMWPVLRAIKYRPADGSDPHVLEMAPIYQEAYNTLMRVKETPRLVATNQIKLLPSYPHLYPTSAAGEKTKSRRVMNDMSRIYAEAENCTRMEELLKAGLSALTKKFYEHTIDFQKGGAFSPENVTPELRTRLSGINRTNTVVESVFALEKFLSTREKGSNLINRRGWTLFKYNKTWVWGEKLNEGKLKLYGRVSRVEARRLRREQGSQRQQLQQLFAAKGEQRQKKLDELRARKSKREAERARLHDPLLRVNTFSGLTQLQNAELIEQLKIRKVVDGRSESSGKPLIVSPPPKGGRAWLVMKLQELLKLEFKEKKLSKNPNDLKKGDLGCDSRAPRKPRVPRSPAEQSAAKGGSKGGKSKKRKAATPELDEDDEFPVEAILDKRLATDADTNAETGTVLYLVSWEGWDSSWNSWEPYDNIIDDELIAEYEARAEAAEDEADEEDEEVAEEEAAEETSAAAPAAANPAPAAPAAAAPAAAAADAAVDASATCTDAAATKDGCAPMDVDTAAAAAAAAAADDDAINAAAAAAAAAATTVAATTADAAMDVESPSTAAATSELRPSFAGQLAACVPAGLQEQIVALESANMMSFKRNGTAFADYFKRWDLTVHTATAADGTLLGFAISSTEGRGKLFLYELHTDVDCRKRGVATTLLDLVEQSSLSRGRTSPMIELNVHTENEAARAFYEHVGFVKTGSHTGDTVLIMSRKR